jgi:hypothetical protein
MGRLFVLIEERAQERKRGHGNKGRQEEPKVGGKKKKKKGSKSKSKSCISRLGLQC